MKLVAAEASHIPFLAENMREYDRVECWASGHVPAAALSHALRASLWALTAIVDDHPHAMMGVVSRNMAEGVGVPWMLGTDRVYDHARDMIRNAPAVIGEMHTTFPILENLVSAGNDRAIRFLRHVGFEIWDDVIMVGGTAFFRFRKEKR